MAVLRFEQSSEMKVHWRGFCKVANILKLSRDEKNQLLQLSSLHQIAYWQNRTDGVYLSRYQVERLSYVLAVFKAALDLMQDQETFARWARTELNNDCLKGQTPVAYMMVSDNKGLLKMCRWLMTLASGLEAFD